MVHREVFVESLELWTRVAAWIVCSRPKKGACDLAHVISLDKDRLPYLWVGLGPFPTLQVDGPFQMDCGLTEPLFHLRKRGSSPSYWRKKNGTTYRQNPLPKLVGTQLKSGGKTPLPLEKCRKKPLPTGQAPQEALAQKKKKPEAPGHRATPPPLADPRAEGPAATWRISSRTWRAKCPRSDGCDRSIGSRKPLTSRAPFRGLSRKIGIWWPVEWQRTTSLELVVG